MSVSEYTVDVRVIPLQYLWLGKIFFHSVKSSFIWGGGGGGGGGGMSIFEYSPRKWPNTHTQKLFLSIFE